MARLVVLLFIAGCSAGPAPIAHAADDPSNPSAPESNEAIATKTAPPTATVFACPMHPEVTSDHAGHCPKCGMTLVPAK